MAATAGLRANVISGLRVFRPLRKRNFALLMTGRVTSEMGRMMRVFVRGWLVLELTGSPFLLGLVTSAITWPMLFMPMFAGVLADRFDRRKLVLISEFSLVAVWAAVSLVITLGLVQWWHLLISSIFSGVIQSFGRTGHQAILGSVVDKEELPSAVAINAVTQHWPQAVGLLLATIFIGTIGIEGVFWITAFGQLITGITLLFLHWTPKKTTAAAQSMGGNFREGFKHVWNDPVILGLVLISGASSLIAGFNMVLLPFFARDILGVGAEGLGVLMIFNALGVSIGSASVLAMGNMLHRGLLVMGGALFYTVFLLSFSQSEVFYLSVGLVFGIGAATTVSRTLMTMIMQMLAPDELRGRIMSFQISIMGLSWVGVLGMGALAEFVGAANTVLIGGSMYGLVVATIFSTRPQLREFR